MVGLTGCMALLAEAGDPELRVFAAPVNELVLCFFIFEFVCKVAHQQAFFCADIYRAAWHALDAALALAGILAYWVLPQQLAVDGQRDALGRVAVACKAC